MPVTIKQFINNPIPSNCFVIYDSVKKGSCIVVDPGTEDMEEVQVWLLQQELTPEYIILTHEHFDHIWGCDALYNKYNCKIICSKNCADAIKDSKKNLSLFYNQKGFEIKQECIRIEDINYKLDWRNYAITFFSTGGHTDAGICFTIDKYVFTGDTLIKNEKTITKLKTGSKEELLRSLNIIQKLKGNKYIICAGHGELFELDEYDIYEMSTK